MAARNLKDQIAFRYRDVDNASGVTRKTVKRLAEHLGVDETQAIHQALRELATRVLPPGRSCGVTFQTASRLAQGRVRR